jgi:uncharacterized damage-inducible protein DinB
MHTDTATAVAVDPIAQLYPELDTEIAATRAMLAIVPWDRADWKPHPRSMSLSGLAIHVAQLPGFTTAMATTDVLPFDPAAWEPAPIKNVSELLAMFDSEASKMRAALGALDSARLAANWKMTMGDQAILDGQRSTMIRHMGINHLVHHRAQLGVYLRLPDVKIPGSYGPSADS